MGTVNSLNLQKPIIIFDGVCNLCDGFVNFIIERDPNAKFQFVALQSDLAKLILKDSTQLIVDAATIVFLYQGKMHIKSSAALHIAKQMRRGWQLFFIFIILPIFIRDGIYELVAKNRYYWFGKMDSCRVPNAEISARFPNSI